MQLPVRPQPGMRIPNGWFTQLWDCLAAAMNISGDRKNIIVRRTSDGTTISLNERGSLASAGGAAASSAYSGPWALSYDADYQKIRCVGGVLNRNGDSVFVQELSADVPSGVLNRVIGIRSEASMATGVFSPPQLVDVYYSGAGGSDPSSSGTGQFFAPLGLWDYNAQRVVQWHCAPVLSIIVSTYIAN